MDKDTKYQDKFSSLIEMVEYLKDEKFCHKYFAYQRWNEGRFCPHCGNDKTYAFSDGLRYKCQACRQQFTARVGTIFEGSKIPLKKWFIGIYLVSSHKKGISSYQLAKDLKVTQKTGWFMLHRIRFSLANGGFELSGTIQCDETFVGGKNKNRHTDKKVKNSQGRCFIDKTPVMGMLQQGEHEIVARPHKINPSKTVREKVITKQPIMVGKVIVNTQIESIQPMIYNNIAKGSIVVSDEWRAYKGIGKDYNHRIVDHGAKEYVNSNGDTSNAVESFWSQFKRSIIGIYHHVSREHLQNYVNESIFRYNTRGMSENERVDATLKGTDGKRLTYKMLIKHN